MSNPWQQAVSQLDQIRKYIDLSEDMYQRLVIHDMIMERALEIKMDDGSIKKFPAYRAQHNNALGPYKGGLRFHPQVTREEVMALSMWMTWKTAALELPLGGGKGGVIVDPKALSNKELERLSRAWMREFADVVGPDVDVPAPDVNTNPQVMNWMVQECMVMQDEKEKQGIACQATFTGKSLDAGGSEGRTQATGRGGFFVLEELAKKMDWQKEKVSIAVQGIGNVGFWFAKLASEAGYNVVAVSDSKGGITTLEEDTDENWFNSGKGARLDIDQVMAYKKKHGSLDGYEGTRAISNQELLQLPVTVIVPAALEGVIDEDMAQRLQAKAVIELANGPTTSEADKVLADCGIPVVPDILANAGGVTVSYFEWQQNLKGEHWSEKDINAKLKKKMVTAFDQIWDEQATLKSENPREVIPLRIAAYAKAVERVVGEMYAGRKGVKA